MPDNVLLVAVLAPVIVNDVPQTVGVSTTIATEQDRITRRGGTASRKAGGEGIRRFDAVVQGGR